MENNKIELSDGTVLLDLTSDTVTPGKLVYGTTAHDRSGAQITGTGLYAASDTDGGDALNAKEVNGHTVESDVPSNAVFTDTVTTVTTSGNGNAVTDVTASNGALTVTKGSTFLTSHQDISGKVNKSGDTMSGALNLDVPLAIASGGTGLTASPSILTNLGSTSAANVLQASPRPGVTGILPVANGGTGSTTKNFVDLSNEQTIGGHKIFTSWVMIDRSASAVGKGNLLNILAFKYKNPQGYAKEAQVIRTYGDTETAANNAIVILGSNSGTTVLCSGESAEPVIDANQAISNTENIYLIADGSINLWTGGNQSTGAVTKAVTVANNGAVTLSSALPIASGGTGAKTADAARTALGIPNSLQSKNSGNTAASLITIAGGSTATGSFDVTVTGSMAVALGGYYLDNGASGTGGTNATMCYLYGIYVADNTLYYRIRNTASSQAKVRLTAFVFYRPKYSDE